ncbi:MAG: pentapeptide repeat-containing protein [Symploca sp. SIO2B6]|nr:pentapeptide repeat-containing protein [Symploca sp. SIO2B6]
MASKEQLTRLKRGVSTWNEWRAKNPMSKPDLSAADLSNMNLSQVNLSDAYLSGASFQGTNLEGANLSKSILIRTNFSRADLHEANLSRASLTRANFSSANLSQIDLSRASLSRSCFVKAELSEANLRQAYLEESDLSGANFSKANLNGVNLAKVQAFGTNFNEAILTAACLGDWSINSATQFEQIDCDYVYLRFPQQERRPISGEFAPGEFIKLFRKSADSIDLTFHNSIDWAAFAYSFKNTVLENKDSQLTVESIDKTASGVISVIVKSSGNSNKAKVHSDLMQNYEFAHKVLEKKAEQAVSGEEVTVIHSQGSINRLFDLINQLAMVENAINQKSP